MYIQAIDGTFTRYCEGNMEWDERHLCTAEQLTEEEAAYFEVYTLIETTPPVIDELRQFYKADVPICIEGEWVQQWIVVDLSANEIERNLFNVEKQRIANLWQAAHNYEYAEISGSAIGLLTLGVLQAKPKCTAVQNWIKSIWNLYYTRKAGTSSDCDYLSCGPCPYTVPELIEETSI